MSRRFSRTVRLFALHAALVIGSAPMLATSAQGGEGASSKKLSRPTAAKHLKEGGKRKIWANATRQRLARKADFAYRPVNTEREAATPNLRSSSVLVVDQRSGSPLYEKNADAVVPIASITKLMTAMVVLDAALDLKEVITITPEDIDTLKFSHSRLPVRSRVTREELLLMALMASENRAAHALGRTYPGGLDAFVDAMNDKAAALGMNNSSFSDPTGLSSRNVSTARDLGRMVAAAHGYPLIRELTTTPSAYVDNGRYPLGFSNTNPLVKNRDWSIGLSKTGYIQEAGKCLVMQAWVAGRPTVMVLLDSAGKLTRIADANRVKRWLEANQHAAVAAEPSA